MTALKAIAAISLCFIFMFESNDQAQTTKTKLEQQNSALKVVVDLKADTALALARLKAAAKPPVVIYRTKYIRPAEVLSANCDTVYYVIKKKPLLRRLLGARPDTIRVGPPTNDY